GPDEGLLVFTSERFGFVLIVSDAALLEREPLVPESETDAVLLTVVVPLGAPDPATAIWNETVAEAPAASDPMFFVRTFAATGSGTIVTPFNFALPAT